MDRSIIYHGYTAVQLFSLDIGLSIKFALLFELVNGYKVSTKDSTVQWLFDGTPKRFFMSPRKSDFVPELLGLLFHKS